MDEFIGFFLEFIIEGLNELCKKEKLPKWIKLTITWFTIICSLTISVVAFYYLLKATKFVDKFMLLVVDIIFIGYLAKKVYLYYKKRNLIEY